MALDGVAQTAIETGHPEELPPGTWLCQGQYRIGSCLNSGGFGIAYLAEDSLGRDVVLKECFVPTFCSRNRTRVTARSDQSKVHLQSVMRGFVNEAHTLAGLSHPNIVRVHQLFEENDTAYMALDYIDGRDLLEVIEEDRARLWPDAIVVMARKLISALAHIHDRHLLHGDVSPDNICLRSDGEPVLIDFGSSRPFVPGAAQDPAGFSLVKDGYSPVELYTNGVPGPWSDIYALGASLYHAVSGMAPVDAQSRQSAKAEGRPDPLLPLAGRYAGYPAGFLDSIDRAMAVDPGARHTSAHDWLQHLGQPRTIAPDRSAALIRQAIAASNRSHAVAGQEARPN